jgi:hypothetical protein
MTKKSVNGEGVLIQYDKHNKVIKKIEGTWDCGIHESKKFMIIHGDAAERGIRLVLVSLDKPAENIEENTNDEASINQQLENAVVRSSQF